MARGRKGKWNGRTIAIRVPEHLAGRLLEIAREMEGAPLAPRPASLEELIGAIAARGWYWSGHHNQDGYWASISTFANGDRSRWIGFYQARNRVTMQTALRDAYELAVKMEGARQDKTPRTAIAADCPTVFQSKTIGITPTTAGDAPAAATSTKRSSKRRANHPNPDQSEVADPSASPTAAQS